MSPKSLMDHLSKNLLDKKKSVVDYSVYVNLTIFLIQNGLAFYEKKLSASTWFVIVKILRPAKLSLTNFKLHFLGGYFLGSYKTTVN